MLNRTKLDLQKAQLRIAELEAILCPNGHDWVPQVSQSKDRLIYKCFRCNKTRVGKPGATK